VYPTSNAVKQSLIATGGNYATILANFNALDKLTTTNWLSNYASITCSNAATNAMYSNTVQLSASLSTRGVTVDPTVLAAGVYQ
jgi:oligoendopeptidase F